MLSFRYELTLSDKKVLTLGEDDYRWVNSGRLAGLDAFTFKGKEYKYTDVVDVREIKEK